MIRRFGKFGRSFGRTDSAEIHRRFGRSFGFGRTLLYSLKEKGGIYSHTLHCSVEKREISSDLKNISWKHLCNLKVWKNTEIYILSDLDKHFVKILFLLQNTVWKIKPSHTTVWKNQKFSHQNIFSWNQLFSNFFSKNDVFTKFLSKSDRM